ncbi:MAG: hypothetical protein ACFB6R_05370 [Alphaproteobacteria bacterium]
MSEPIPAPQSAPRSAIQGLDSPSVLQARTGDQALFYTVVLGALFQVLAFGVFITVFLDHRALLNADPLLLPHALYTLGSIIAVTYIQMTVFPVLRWPLAFPDLAILFLAAIGQIVAARLMLDPKSWWIAIAVLHFAATAAFLHARLRLRADHLGPADCLYAQFRAGVPVLALIHGVVSVAAALCALYLPKTAFWTWTAMEVITLATILAQIIQERWLSRLYQAFGLKRFGWS